MTPKRLSAEALAEMAAYHWPGNVRQLSHAIESAVLISEGPIIGPEHLGIQAPRPVPLSIEMTTREPIQLDFASADCPRLEELEHEVIESAVRYCENNLSRAARILGISRDAIRYRLERYKSAEASQR